MKKITINDISIPKKRLIEILEELKYFILLQDNDFTYTGICKVIGYFELSVRITFTEARFIEAYIKSNVPTKDNQYKEFTENEYWDNKPTGYWWTKMYENPETIKVRIDYLSAVINNIK